MDKIAIAIEIEIIDGNPSLMIFAASNEELESEIDLNLAERVALLTFADSVMTRMLEKVESELDSSIDGIE